VLAKGLAILLHYAAGHDLCGDGIALYGGAQQTFTTFMVVCDVWWSGNINICLYTSFVSGMVARLVGLLQD
jgi:hypothetical protein